MRYGLIVAMLLSVLVHVLLIAGLTFSINANLGKSDSAIKSTKPNLNANTLQVGFIHLSAPESLVLEKKLNMPADKHSGAGINAVLESEHKVQKTAPSDRLSAYLKPSDVDMRAIPMHGITPPIQVGVGQLLEVYRLRVFVNKRGNVERVINLDNSTSKQLFYADIERQVKELLFIPAKKEGLAVDSYIDIALEF